MVNVIHLAWAIFLVALIFLFPGFFLGLLLLILAAAALFVVFILLVYGMKVFFDAISGWWKKSRPAPAWAATTGSNEPTWEQPVTVDNEIVWTKVVDAEPLTDAEAWLKARLGYVIRNGKYLSGMPASAAHIRDTRTLLFTYYCRYDDRTCDLRDAALARACGAAA